MHIPMKIVPGDAIVQLHLHQTVLYSGLVFKRKVPSRGEFPVIGAISILKELTCKSIKKSHVHY
jgi:hypothetical protein